MEERLSYWRDLPPPHVMLGILARIHGWKPEPARPPRITDGARRPSLADVLRAANPRENGMSAGKGIPLLEMLRPKGCA